jgi:hypothetical protein
VLDIRYNLISNIPISYNIISGFERQESLPISQITVVFPSYLSFVRVFLWLKFTWFIDLTTSRGYRIGTWPAPAQPTQRVQGWTINVLYQLLIPHLLPHKSLRRIANITTIAYMPRMTGRKTTTDWERYPFNPTSSDCQAEWEQYRSHISEAASHLFAQNGDTTAVEAIIPNGTAPWGTSTLSRLLLTILESSVALIDSPAALDEYFNTVGIF